MDSIIRHAQKISRPVRAVQFGQGNFLRAFADHMLDIANEEGIFNGSVAVIKPTGRGNLDQFTRQDCLYTVILRGRENSEVVNEERIITCLDHAVSPYEDPDCLRRLGETDTIEFILSNTTEAGIALTGDEQPSDRPCASFPGKLCQLLHARYRHFHGSREKGVTVLPAELIEKNGGKLKACIRELAVKWALEEDFLLWLDEACVFCNTLVDRIVTGFPAAEAEALFEKLGYEDALLDVGEPFGLWVIECGDPEALQKKLPLDAIGLPVIFTKDLTPYRERKVRILNGAHTSSVPAAYLAGEDIVRGMMHNPVARAYLDRAVYDELLPTVPLPEAEVRAFAGAVMERFDNPFIDHQLLAISLNSVSKWRARVLPSVRDTVRAKGTPPRCLTFSFAALIAFYTPSAQGENQLTGLRDGQPYPIRDDQAVLDFFWENRSEADAQALVQKLCARADFWGEDLNGIEGFASAAAGWLRVIREQGMKAALELAAKE